jgi:hypothetical protein
VGEQHTDKKDDDSKYMMYTHKDLIIKYNQDQVWHTTCSVVLDRVNSTLITISSSCFVLLAQSL